MNKCKINISLCPTSAVFIIKWWIQKLAKGQERTTMFDSSSPSADANGCLQSSSYLNLKLNLHASEENWSRGWSSTAYWTGSISIKHHALTLTVFLLFRPDLKLVLMSATLNSEMFSSYFGIIIQLAFHFFFVSKHLGISQVQFIKLTSVFHASVLLLIMNFVISSCGSRRR